MKIIANGFYRAENGMAEIPFSVENYPHYNFSGSFQVDYQEAMKAFYEGRDKELIAQFLADMFIRDEELENENVSYLMNELGKMNKLYNEQSKVLNNRLAELEKLVLGQDEDGEATGDEEVLND